VDRVPSWSRSHITAAHNARKRPLGPENRRAAVRRALSWLARQLTRSSSLRVLAVPGPGVGKLARSRLRIEEGRPIQPTQADFENLLSFRVALRRFQHWSEDQASAVGLTHVQHQLLVAIKGHPGRLRPAIGEIADYLLLQSHSVVGLVDRAEAAGFVRRRPDAHDARVVRVELTDKGDRLVTELTEAHLAELYKLAEAMSQLLPDGWTR
jgi:DNA-binding MarR family transcriptional regulator